MRYNKNVQGGYILAIGTGAGGEEITEQEYAAIKAVIDARPAPPDGYGYRLTATEIWEQYALPPVEDDPDVDADAALAEIAEVIG
jgi:hypothetical protein